MSPKEVVINVTTSTILLIIIVAIIIVIIIFYTDNDSEVPEPKPTQLEVTIMLSCISSLETKTSHQHYAAFPHMLQKFTSAKK